MRSLKTAAVSGSLWSGMHMMVNKATSLVGTLVTMYLLAPDAFGVAAVATSTLSYVTILPAFTLSDVLLAQPSRVAATLPTATRMCTLDTAFSILLLIAVGYASSEHLGDVRILHASLLLAVRPLGELLMAGAADSSQSEPGLQSAVEDGCRGAVHGDRGHDHDGCARCWLREPRATTGAFRVG